MCFLSSCVQCQAATREWHLRNNVEGRGGRASILIHTNMDVLMRLIINRETPFAPPHHSEIHYQCELQGGRHLYTCRRCGQLIIVDIVENWAMSLVPKDSYRPYWAKQRHMVKRCLTDEELKHPSTNPNKNTDKPHHCL